MRIAMSLNISVIRGPEERMIPRLAAAGFDGLDFHFCDLLDRVDWFDDAAVAALLGPWQDAAAAHGMAWVQGHGPMFHMFGQTPQDERARALCVPAIRAAGRLGVPWLVFHPDVFAGAFDAAHRRAVRDANAAFFRTLLPACEEANVGLAIENIFDSAARGGRKAARFYGAVPDELCELIDAIGHPLVGACWDTGHARMMGHDQRAAIASLGPRLKALHIQENDGNSDDHQLPFVTARGVDWAGVAAGLRDAGYAGAFTYEARNGLDAVPDALLDDTLALAVKTARHIVGLIGA